jgi:DNA topoisomerase-1
MMKNLVIVESGAKGKTIEKYLNTDELKKYGLFKVVASNGHIRDLVKKKEGTESGINVSTWIAHYEPLTEKQTVISKLKAAIKDADMVWLAADLDREGEGIAWHIKEHFKLTPKKYKRITFNEITQKAIVHAVKNPRDIDYNLVDAQQGRRILDRIIGFRLTQTLWRNFDTFSTMSAGRVQSVLLMILCANEQKITEFKSECYWNMIGKFKLGTINIEDAKLYASSGTLTKYTDKEVLIKFIKALNSATFKIDKNNTKIKQRKENPPPPFITSTLQQDAHSKCGFSSKLTMKIAQELYEAGKITYMRTDSTNMSNDAMKMISEYVGTTYTAQMFSDNNAANGAKKSKNAQEAHEAIRPTKMKKDFEGASKEQKKLYDLIFNRTIASQMVHAIYEELNITIAQTINSDIFVGKSKALISPGYLVVYDTKKEVSMDPILKSIHESNKTITPVQVIGNHVWMTPPQHFNESKVIKTLESLGIGRPSTYATILDKLFERQYIVTKDIIGEEKAYEDYVLDFQANKIQIHKESKSYFNEKSKIVPTENGQVINNFITSHFSKIINVDFTSLMEDDLDAISNGEKKLTDVMKRFYTPFAIECEKLKKNIDAKTKVEGHNKDMTIGGKVYTVRNAKYGPVIQHSNDKDEKAYINLSQYLKDTDKRVEDMNEKDVRFLASIPKRIDENRTLMYGRYGFYIQFSNGKPKPTLRVYKNKVQDILNNNFESF